jgi:hypothetical protein
VHCAPNDSNLPDVEWWHLVALARPPYMAAVSAHRPVDVDDESFASPIFNR